MPGAALVLDPFIGSACKGRNNARHRKSRIPLGDMGQGLDLHIHDAFRFTYIRYLDDDVVTVGAPDAPGQIALGSQVLVCPLDPVTACDHPLTLAEAGVSAAADLQSP